MPGSERFCPCGFTGWTLGLFTAEWWRHHRGFHFAVFPAAVIDTATVDNFRQFIESAERREEAIADAA